MSPSTEGDIDSVGRSTGEREGGCDVYITQKQGNLFTVVKILVRVRPKESAETVYSRLEKWYTPESKREIRLGSAKGFTVDGQTVLVSDCAIPGNGTSKKNIISMSIRVLYPDHRSTLDVKRSQLDEGAAKLTAATARYVNSSLLNCAAPHLPNGAPEKGSQNSTVSLREAGPVE